MRGMYLCAVSGFVAACAVGSAQAQVIWDEGTQGDISGDRLAPNAFALAGGDNRLNGVFGGDGPNGHDIDYFSITIPAGFALTQIVHEAYESDDDGCFIGIAAGSTFPIAPEDATPANLMGWAIFGSATVGVDFLPTMAGNGIGFDTPLPAGTYTFWAQQTGDPTNYTLNFVVVPAPAGAVALIGGVLLMGRRRR